MRWCQLL
jgi:hypothetical protein